MYDTDTENSRKKRKKQIGRQNRYFCSAILARLSGREIPNANRVGGGRRRSEIFLRGLKRRNTSATDASPTLVGTVYDSRFQIYIGPSRYRVFDFLAGIATIPAAYNSQSHNVRPPLSRVCLSMPIGHVPPTFWSTYGRGTRSPLYFVEFRLVRGMEYLYRFRLNGLLVKHAPWVYEDGRNHFLSFSSSFFESKGNFIFRLLVLWEWK